MKTNSHWPAVGATSWVKGFLLIAALPFSANAGCQKWDLSGEWEMSQGSTDIYLNLRQNAKTVTGTARHSGSTGTGGGFGVDFGAAVTVRGVVNGTVDQGDFRAEISWDGGKLVGVYSGKITPEGRISGTTYDKTHPSSRATWSSTHQLQCLDNAAPPIKPSSVLKPKPSVPPAPLQSRERATERTPAPPRVESTPVTSATIKAVPQLVSIPDGKDEGFARLVWSAGNQHPNAQLMVKVDGGDEEVADSQSKGSRNVKVEAGRTYLYMVVDNGERLAAVTVATNKSAQRLDRQERRRRN